MKIWTQSWRPDPITLPRLRGIVAIIHGYASESSWLLELTALAIARTGFIVCTLDLQGHGYSDGCPGNVPNIYVLVGDCIQFFDSVRNSNPKLPALLYGESLGGAIAILVRLKQESGDLEPMKEPPILRNSLPRLELFVGSSKTETKTSDPEELKETAAIRPPQGCYRMSLIGKLAKPLLIGLPVPSNSEGSTRKNVEPKAAVEGKKPRQEIC